MFFIKRHVSALQINIRLIHAIWDIKEKYKMPFLLHFFPCCVTISLRTHCVCTPWKCGEGCHCLSLVNNYRFKMDSWHHLLLENNCRWEPGSWHSFLLATVYGNLTAGTTSYWQITVDANLATDTTSYWQLSMEIWQLAPLPIGNYRWKPNSWYHFLLANNCRLEPGSWHSFLLATVYANRTAGTTYYWQITVDGNRTASTTYYWQITVDWNLAGGTVSYWQLSMQTGQLAPLPTGNQFCYAADSDSTLPFTQTWSVLVRSDVSINSDIKGVSRRDFNNCWWKGASK